jgi:hypothetical protein
MQQGQETPTVPTSELYQPDSIQKPDPSYPVCTNAILALLQDPLIYDSTKRGDEFVDELRTHIELETLLDTPTYKLQVAHRALYKVLLAANAMTTVGRGRSIVDETLRKLTSETIESTIDPNETERATMEKFRTEVRAAHRASQTAENNQSAQAALPTATNSPAADSSTIAAAVYRAAVNNRDPLKLVGALAAKFPENAKFSGTGEPTLADVLNRYDDAISEMTLTHTEQKQYAHLLLTGEAKRFYDTHIRNIAATFTDIRMLLQREYETPVKQQAVLATLQSLRVPALVRSGLTEAKAIQACYDEITRKIDSVPKEYRSETHKCEFLRAAALGCGEWSNKAISDYYRLPADQRSLARLHQDLIAALSIHNDAAQASARDRASTVANVHPSLYVSPESDDNNEYDEDTWYHNDRYSELPARRGYRGGVTSGRRISALGRHAPSRAPAIAGRNRHSQPQRRSETYRRNVIQSDQCFRCGKRGHYAVNCRNDPRSMTDALKARMQVHFSETPPETYDDIIHDLQDAIMVLAQQCDDSADLNCTKDNMDEVTNIELSRTVQTLFTPENVMSRDRSSPAVATSNFREL